ncbi:hypothetical protein BDV59DRAFT_116129 [Aspergillus ambiguus]|uniref:uncharacterized protein n=1 Tax=Aspergillus ambiguus TaxID=176160 RepID=UPI003CCCD63A
MDAPPCPFTWRRWWWWQSPRPPHLHPWMTGFSQELSPSVGLLSPRTTFILTDSPESSPIQCGQEWSGPYLSRQQLVDDQQHDQSTCESSATTDGSCTVPACRLGEMQSAPSEFLWRRWVAPYLGRIRDIFSGEVCYTHGGPILSFPAMTLEYP